MRVLLLAGSWSPEAEVSLAGAKCIQEALEGRGHSVTLCNPLYEFDTMLEKAKQHDLVFINMHGSPGEDGLIQAMLSQAGCKYQGSKAQGSFLATHKSAAKQLFRLSNIQTADWHFLPVKPEKSWKPQFDFPLFVKSNNGGSSIDMAKVHTQEELEEVMERLFSKSCELIIEPMIKGIEITCGVIERKNEIFALPPVLIRPKTKDFFDYETKYTKGAVEEICPAPLSEEIIKKVQETALKAHKALGLKDYSRSDFILTENNELFILETNILPGMTETSLFPQEMKVAGYEFVDLLEILLENALNS